MKLEILASDEDLQKYINGRISELPDFVKSDIDFQNKVKAAIIKAVEGMYVPFMLL